jgi:hypothetical protein
MVTYLSFLTTAVSQGAIEPVFSMAISISSSDGVLGWGGLSYTAYDAQTNATTDLIIANLIDKDDTAWKPSLYTIIPDGVRWDTALNWGQYPYIVDSGTTMMYMPPRRFRRLQIVVINHADSSSPRRCHYAVF